MSKDLTPLEQAQRAYQDLRGMAEEMEKAAIALQKDAKERQAGIEEAANKALDHLIKAGEIRKEYESLCRHCSEKNPADAVYCRQCGKEIERPEEEAEAAEEAAD